ncbi:MAG: hypothetical protein CRN43_20440 [Candidatus Nephrothrix sp. EaCA]|nr:MAG: hypothetical protein CRN43_20440 [Candidatus Nephrothrix sp. EaCA]
MQQVSIALRFHTAGQHRFHSAGQQRNTSDSRSASLYYTAGQQRNTNKATWNHNLTEGKGRMQGQFGHNNAVGQPSLMYIFQPNKDGRRPSIFQPDSIAAWE